MPVRVLPIGPDAYMGAAIGSLAPGTRFDVHFHYSLEQLTFVLKGRVWLTMLGPNDAEPVTEVLDAGQAITNPPGMTLSFANEGVDPTEVLFVCAPPFPPDDSEVVVTGEHRPLSEGERARAAERRGWALEHFARIASRHGQAGA
jgi:mannose-6-phosphate isomerase-like protein (cupin superfamily)